MKIIPTLFHGISDYLVGIILLLAPNLFGFSDVGGAAVWVPRVIGAVILLQSVLTDYEVGLMKVISMKMHLMNDYVASIILAASPWLFGFHTAPRNVWMPHLVVGLLILAISLMTEKEPRRARRAAHA